MTKLKMRKKKKPNATRIHARDETSKVNSPTEDKKARKTQKHVKHKQGSKVMTKYRKTQKHKKNHLVIFCLITSHIWKNLKFKFFPNP